MIEGELAASAGGVTLQLGTLERTTAGTEGLFAAITARGHVTKLVSQVVCNLQQMT